MTIELFRQDAYARRCDAQIIGVGEFGLRLDRTVFFPTGGGQPGDRGRLLLSDGSALDVVDTVKSVDGIEVLHRVSERAPQPNVGTRLIAEVYWPRRHRLMRMHSALHLLCAAVDQPVSGGQVGEYKSRLDFDLKNTKLDKTRIAEIIEDWIAEDRPIREHWIDAEEFRRRPELVRTMGVTPPVVDGRVRLIEIEGIDLQACGGTHVRSTGEIGGVNVGKIESKGRQNRRVHLVLVD
jgi:misacylated tRNA(Ala) deacylase